MQTQTLSTGATLTPFLLPQPARLGVLITPGGGYGMLATQHEGHAIGAWLNARGHDAWMLEYRVVSADSPSPLNGQPLEDVGLALDAIRAQRRNEKLGIWGFSAGGHLAATAATSHGLNLNFAVLAYPVIDFVGPATHVGSRDNLLGAEPTDAQIAEFSPLQRVSAQTPPTFLFHTVADTAVPPQNSLLMAQQLADYDVPFELHIYCNGPHGVGLADGKFGAPDLPDVADWGERLGTWLVGR